MSSVASNTTTVSMTMTYIPVQTPNNSNNNNKLLYLPVNSVPASTPSKQQQHQQHPQQTREGNGAPKTVLLSHSQNIQPSNTIVTMTPISRSDGAFTTVRIQGDTQNTLVPKSPFSHVAMKQGEGNNGGGGVNATQGMNSPSPREMQQITNGRKDKRKHVDRMLDVSPFGGISSPVHKKRRGRPPSCELSFIITPGRFVYF